MGNNKALTAAIVTAVHAYMEAQKEDEAGRLMMQSFNHRKSLWSLAGRQEIMSQRQYWQLKMFNGHRLQQSSFLKNGFDPNLAKPKQRSPILLGINE